MSEIKKGKLSFERRAGESIWIGDTQIYFQQVRPLSKKVRVVVLAPLDVNVVRGEVLNKRTLGRQDL